ncbi:16S rRNA (cytosine(967)-C(5))-methyltransferase RsmB [Eubacterium sp. AF22-8LB]|uniref:16S rRNA (cytosine(967)-C(5))-methyltransferase RsmB n=1 Tax=Eubacterium sp. AF22-8LB TaxID=2292232 RepID=UPI000E51ECAB|nr:16S rRNA (cytosine(967)-C(5))-methyltransferase RsmB [Eubacterium sp. AF22-8LB]RGS32143.1 16S rRNA (cytosine(967)-C(5))-methyltransferase RsmB [Eubacterium sp. AF22-8LB]
MRKWLWKALDEVVNKEVYSNLYLRNHLHEVSERDRALATRIFYGTIQNYRYCRACWSKFVENKVNDKMDVLLTMSTYQLLFLDKVPSYAIVNDAVNIAKRINVKYAGLTNAVLHKVKHIETKDVALKYSLPDWLYKMWVSQYGQEQALIMAKASVNILPLYVRRNVLKTEVEDFSSSEFICVKDPLYIYTQNDYFHHPYYQKGYMSAQDEGSFAIAKFVDPKENEKILDCCAAPGTKTMAMAEMMYNKGHIDSFDLHAHRKDLIESDAKRLGIDIVHAGVQDATKFKSSVLYDRILCDVPCSGYGVLSRKPDIKLRMLPEDMDTLIPLQYAILNNVCQYVKEGGFIVYSTCTMNKKENEKQIQRFLKEHDMFRLVDEVNIFSDSKQDGFYMAKLVRK